MSDITWVIKHALIPFLCGTSVVLLIAEWVDDMVNKTSNISITLDLSGLEKAMKAMQAQLDTKVAIQAVQMGVITPEEYERYMREPKRDQIPQLQRYLQFLQTILPDISVVSNIGCTFFSPMLESIANLYASELMNGAEHPPINVLIQPDGLEFFIIATWNVRRIQTEKVDPVQLLTSKNLQETFREATRLAVFNIIGDEEVED